MPLGPPDLSATVRSFSFPITLRRFGPATVNADFRKVDGPPTDTEVLGHAFPAPGKTLQQLPEGYEGTRVIEVHLETVVVAGDEASQQPPDQVLYDGAIFRVIKVSRWNEGPAGARSWNVVVAAELPDEEPTQ